MFNVKVLSLAAAMLAPLAVNAQPAAQDWELTLGGNGRFENDFKRSNATGRHGGEFGAAIGLGYYLNDNFEAGVRQSLRYATTGTWEGSTRAFVDYNILMDRLVPFIGANVGYSYANKNQDDSWAFGPEAGIKYYLQEKAFIFGMAEYQMPFQGKTFQEGFWNLTLGLGVNL